LLLSGKNLPSLAASRFDNRAPALLGPAMTDVELPLFFRQFPVVLVGVIVGELHSGLDIASGFDKYPAIFPDRLAVRIAGMVYKTGYTAGAGGVDSRVFVDFEEESVMAQHRVVIVPPGLLFGVDDFPGVFDYPLSFAYTPRGEYTSALYSGLPDFHRRLSVPFCCRQDYMTS
jgi:hypothetical protein